METKEFKFIKNILWPVKSIVRIGDDGIFNKGHLVSWNSITDFSCHIMSINGSMNYTVRYKDAIGSNHVLAYGVAMTGKKKKKQMFAELYDMILEGFYQYKIKPDTEENLEKIKAGETVELDKTKVSAKGVTIMKGLIKKEPCFIAMEDLELSYPAGSGGMRIASKVNKKDAVLISFETQKARHIDALLRCYSTPVEA